MTKDRIKEKIKRILREFYILPVPIVAEKIDPQWQWLGNLGIKSVLNIGANEGQLALDLRKHIPSAMIYAFEPLPGPLEVLNKNFSEDKNFQALPFALGEEEGTVKMYLNEHSPSSSLLKMDDNHKKHFSFTEKEFEVDVSIKRLDDVAAELHLPHPLLITLDVQGFEIAVIKGGLSTIAKADVIITEVSFTKLYDQQPFFSDVHLLLTSLGFRYAGNFEQLTSPVTGAVLQADAIFVKQ